MHMDVDDTIFCPRSTFDSAEYGPPNIGDGGRRIIGDGTIVALDRAGDTNATLPWTASGERVAAAAAVATIVVRMFFIVYQESPSNMDK
jgi:hypothetical protein